MSYVKIIQQNVIKWTKERATELSNYFTRENADIVMINATGVPETERIRIYNYNVIQKNVTEEEHAGVAIAVKKTIKYKPIDDNREDILGIQIETTRGPLNILTHYSPPRRPYLPMGEIRRQMQRPCPVFLAGDLNAAHPDLGHARENAKGKQINELINRNIMTFLGPDFGTLVGRKGKPDIILVNRHNIFNITITQGELTTGDHIPIILKISTRPILKDQIKRKNFKRANWDGFKDRVLLRLDGQTETNRLNGQETKQTIDETLGQWINDIKEAVDDYVPMTKVSYYRHAKTSDLLRLFRNDV